MKDKSKKTIRIKPSTYQPSKAELEEKIKLTMKGRTIDEKMKNAAKAIFCGAEVRHEE